MNLKLSAAGIAFAASMALPAAPQMDLGRLAAAPHTQTLGPDAAESINYLTAPPERIREVVPALKGLRPEAGQEALPEILAGVAKTIAAVLPRLPNLVSKEEIFHFQGKRDAAAAGGLANLQPWSREFKYLILSHHGADGNTTIEELRTDAKGHSADGAGQFTAPRGYGFAYQWLFFSAANQEDFRFRLLGQQEKDGRKTWVVAFAQDPARVRNPALFQSEGKVAPFYYQGVLWVDRGSFDIVRLRTDLLTPLPELHLRQMTTEVAFRSVPIHGFDAVFWLPSEVSIASDQGGGLAEESHRYSDYHLFHTDTRIIPEP